MNRVGQTRYINAKIGCAFTIDLNRKLRLCRFDRQARLQETGIFFKRRNDRIGSRTELGVIIADDSKLQAVTGTADAKAVGLSCENTHPCYASRACFNIGQNFLLRTTAFLPWGQCKHHEAIIGRTARTGNRIGSENFTAIAQRLHGLFDLIELRLKKLDTDTLWTINAQKCRCTIFGRRQFLSELSETNIGCTCKKHRCQHHNERRRKTGMQAFAIEISKPTTNTTHEERAMATTFRFVVAFFQKP